MPSVDTRAAIRPYAFLLLTLIGIPSNLAICFAFLRALRNDSKLLTADIILCHLTFANLMLGFTRGIPQTLHSFGYKLMFSDLGCKLIILSFRSFRGLSISLTCLLSTYQAVVISPASSKLDPLKLQIPRFLMHTVIILYMLYFVSCTSIAIHGVASLVNNTMPPYTFNIEFCYVTLHTFVAFFGTGIAVMMRDLVFIVLMTIMSGYILLLLYRHSKKVKSIRSSDRTQLGARAQLKASRAVVTLVTIYVVFFGIDGIMWLYSISGVWVEPLITDIRIYFTMLYSSVCPIVIIATNPKVQAKLQVYMPDRTTHSVNTLCK
ncbi:olfactory receptor class A-like protein 1 [Polypterus senegalus]|uniref:olfactory receptor class A-like protein 1 n=1 Tax=Polypterus senegalus TaxID=55291 RepID=UPI001965489F|nr:olfactory receptor class A-like protein 1 [Polypterus senegalus]